MAEETASTSATQKALAVGPPVSTAACAMAFAKVTAKAEPCEIDQPQAKPLPSQETCAMVAEYAIQEHHEDLRPFKKTPYQLRWRLRQLLRIPPI